LVYDVPVALVDQVGDVVVVTRHAEAEAVVGDRLLKAEVVADALFG
jgi:hypothetical protein